MADTAPTAPRTGFSGLWAKVLEFNRNIWGSDATIAYSAEYAWLSNQMSHAMMGFFVASLWVLVLRHPEVVSVGWLPSWWPVWPAWLRYDPEPPVAILLLLLLPVVKDAIDYGMDVWWRSGEFEVNKAELRLDWVTDDFFWISGMVLSIAVFGFNSGSWWWVIGTVAVGGTGAYYLIVRVWVPQKRMFDASRMPFNFVRLIKYPDPQRLFTKPEMEKLADFQKQAAAPPAGPPAGTETPPPERPRHYVLVGGRPIHRSRLAVSMGCEYISHWKGVYMISAVKVMEDPGRMTVECQMPPELKTQLHCLIIDDLNVGLPIPSADQSKRTDQKADLQSKHPTNQANLSAAEVGESLAEKVIDFVDVFAQLRTKFPRATTIWVLSAKGTPEDRARVEAWKAFIDELVTGVTPSGALVTIELNNVPGP